MAHVIYSLLDHKSTLSCNQSLGFRTITSNRSNLTSPRTKIIVTKFEALIMITHSLAIHFLILLFCLITIDATGNDTRRNRATTAALFAMTRPNKKKKFGIAHV
eukprot:762344_1